MHGNFTRTKRFKITAAVITVIVLAGTLAYLMRDRLVRQIFKPTDTTIEQGVDRPSEDEEAISVVAENLDIPWEIAFLPNGEMLVTERPGTLKRVSGNGTAHDIDGVAHTGEGGLLGLAIDPDFDSNRKVYLYMTTENGNNVTNRVVRYTYAGDTLSEPETIVGDIPGARIHNGGRIAFGPDNLLYITTGDAAETSLAQDRDSLAGKILRVNPDGSIPNDNPFGTTIYSWGHRNPQGLAWDEEGRLWSTEHGPTGFDEINLIEPGSNYGWPLVTGDEEGENLTAPAIHSGRDETWAPSGMAYLDGSLFFAGLRGSTLYQAQIGPDGNLSLKGHFRNQWGRLRTAVLGPDGYLYVTTSNRDGRGEAQSNDDKIIRINPQIF